MGFLGYSRVQNLAWNEAHSGIVGWDGRLRGRGNQTHARIGGHIHKCQTCKRSICDVAWCNCIAIAILIPVRVRERRDDLYLVILLRHTFNLYVTVI